MADASAMRRCAKIISSDPDKKLIVVSATSGTTNLLKKLTEPIGLKLQNEIINQIREKHLAICDDIKHGDEVMYPLHSLLDELEKIVHGSSDMSTEVKDHIYSFGERMSSLLFSQVLKEGGEESVWFDAREVIITDDQYGSAEPNITEIEKKCDQKLIPLLQNARIVTQGFIGSTKNGVTTTLGRGGSDYSAALFAEGINADVLEIWTDVTAIYTTDPRLVKDARPITEISFDEAAELSVFGAKVLHPATLKPAIRKAISVYVGSSINPEKPGTWIVKKAKNNPVIRAISLRRNQTLLNVHSLDMLHRSGFLVRVFEVLAKYKISVDLVTTSEVSVSLTLDTDVQSSVQDHLTDEVLDELREFCDVNIEKDLSLVALVGSNLHATAGLSGPVFESLNDVNIRLICHGASSHNLCFLVNEKQAEDVVQILHHKFITNTKLEPKK